MLHRQRYVNQYRDSKIVEKEKADAFAVWFLQKSMRDFTSGLFKIAHIFDLVLCAVLFSFFFCKYLEIWNAGFPKGVSDIPEPILHEPPQYRPQARENNLAQFLTIARNHTRGQGFNVAFYIEPKPMEPSKRHYDFDVETVAGILRYNGLDKDFRIKIEANHAELAGHDFQHEMETTTAMGFFSSIHANCGAPATHGESAKSP